MAKHCSLEQGHTWNTGSRTQNSHWLGDAENFECANGKHSAELNVAVESVCSLLYESWSWIPPSIANVCSVSLLLLYISSGFGISFSDYYYYFSLFLDSLSTPANISSALAQVAFHISCVLYLWHNLCTDVLWKPIRGLSEWNNVSNLLNRMGALGWQIQSELFCYQL